MAKTQVKATKTQGKAKSPTNANHQLVINKERHQKSGEYNALTDKNANQTTPEKIRKELDRIKLSTSQHISTASQTYANYGQMQAGKIIIAATRQTWLLLSEIAGGVLLAYAFYSLYNISLDKLSPNAPINSTYAANAQVAKPLSFAISMLLGASGGLYSYLKRVWEAKTATERKEKEAANKVKNVKN